MDRELSFNKLMKKRQKKQAPAGPPKSELELLCEKHRIPVQVMLGTASGTGSLPPLPEGWKEKLSPAAREHLKDRPRRLRVHLMRGVEVVIWWPAAYMEGNYLYYLGETIPIQARAASRPGNFIIEVVGGCPKSIVLRKSVGGDLNKYYFAYVPKGLRQVRTLGHHDWKVCSHLAILEDNFIGLS